MWFRTKKKKKKHRKNPHGQHNLMRQSVKGTKWITKCRVGLWVGGWRMKSVIFQHPSAVSLLTGRGGKKKKKSEEWETDWGGRWCVWGSLCQKLDQRRQIQLQYMYSIWRDQREKREEGQKQCHYLNVSPPACLDRQDLHVGFTAQSPGAGRGGVRWVEIVIFVVLRVWLLWEQRCSRQGSLSAGHTSDLRTRDQRRSHAPMSGSPFFSFSLH